MQQEIVERQSFADGQAYTYAFEGSPHSDGKLPTIAGGTYTNAQGERTEVLYDWPVAPTGTAQCTFQCPDPRPTDPQMHLGLSADLGAREDRRPAQPNHDLRLLRSRRPERGAVAGGA